jgi:hypothetical protein
MARRRWPKVERDVREQSLYSIVVVRVGRTTKPASSRGTRRVDDTRTVISAERPGRVDGHRAAYIGESVSDACSQSGGIDERTVVEHGRETVDHDVPFRKRRLVHLEFDEPVPSPVDERAAFGDQRLKVLFACFKVLG